MNNYTMFYLRTSFWAGTCLKSLTSIRIRRNDPDNVLEFTRAVELASGKTVFVEPTTLASVPPQLQSVVNFSVLGKDDTGVSTLLGWMDELPDPWPGAYDHNYNRDEWEVYIDGCSNICISRKEKESL